MMRGLVFIFMILATIAAVSFAYVPKIPKPRPDQPGFPSFPGQGPFNPRPRPYPLPVHRFRRSPDDKGNGKITIHGQKEGSKSSYNVDYEHKIYENKHGSVGIHGGVNKHPYHKPESHVGIGGSFQFG